MAFNQVEFESGKNAGQHEGELNIYKVPTMTNSLAQSKWLKRVSRSKFTVGFRKPLRVKPVTEE